MNEEDDLMDTFNHDLVVESVQNNQSALHFLECLCYVMHLWDDLADRDKPRSIGTINRAFWMALVELPRNQFYSENFHLLSPIIMMAIQNWHAANYMERGDDHLENQIAFIIRSSYADIVTMCALIIGGPEWSKRIAVAIRKEAHKEGFETYLENLAKERSERK